MARTRRHVSDRTRSRDRHGRGIRSSVAGPHLPPLQTRSEYFDSVVAATAEYLRDLWPDELAGVSFEVGLLPSGPLRDGIDRWQVFPQQRRVVLYRLPIQRMMKLHRNDDWHRRAVIESCVFRAVAELLGRDPWDLAPNRFLHF